MSRSFLMAFRRTLRNLAEFRFLNVVTVSVVAISLLLVATYGLVLFNLSHVLDRWGQDVQVSAYLAPGLGEATVFRVKEEIEARAEVAEVVYVSQSQATREFIRMLPEAAALLSDLPANPLPASLEVRLRADLQEPGRIAAFAASIRRPEFAEIDYSQEWVERFYAFVHLLRVSGLILGTLVVGASVFVVHNTIKLTVYARREELEVMRLVGATDGFIQAPFLLEGAIQGTLGGLLGMGSLYALYRFLATWLERSVGLGLGSGLVQFLPPPWIAAVLVSGLLLGLAGSFLSLRRFLHAGRA